MEREQERSFTNVRPERQGRLPGCHAVHNSPLARRARDRSIATIPSRATGVRLLAGGARMGGRLDLSATGEKFSTPVLIDHN